MNATVLVTMQLVLSSNNIKIKSFEANTIIIHSQIVSGVPYSRHWLTV